MAVAGAFCRAAPSDQEYLVDVWNVDHGLPQGSVMHVAQTPDGYLWVATFWQGIARFDGVRFVNYTPVTTPELPDQEGWRLMVDSRGTLWINSLQGSLTSFQGGRFALEFKRKWRLKALVAETADLVIFATVDGKLLRGPAAPGHGGPWEVFQPPDASADSQFAAGADGTIWHLRRGRPLARWRGGEFEQPATPPELRGRRMRALAADPAGRIWVGTDMELAVWNGSHFEDMTPTNGEPNLSVLRMAFARDGSLWVEANDRLRKCRDRCWSVEAQGWTGEFGPTADPLQVNCDAAGGVWFTHVGDGMIHVRPDGTTRRLNTDSGLPNNLTRCWFQDREGNVWTGSERGGLIRVQKRDFFVLGKGQGLTDASLTSVAEDAEGALWCGSLNGMLYRWQGGQCEAFTLPMRGGRTRCVTVYPGVDRLWIGTSGNGVLERQGEEFKHVLDAGQIGVVARTTLADKHGRVWVGNERELYCWDGQSLHSLAIYALALAEGPDRTIWAGDSAGDLCRIRPKPDRAPVNPQSSAGGENSAFEVERYRPSDNPPACRAWALLAEADGSVWMATDGAGLLRFREGKSVRFTTAQGLPSNTIFQVLDDKQGRLWLGVRSGLACAEKSSFEKCAQQALAQVPFQVYGRYDGLPTLELCSGYQPACWRGRDGRLWFATANGVVFVQPADLRVNPLPPPVVLEQVRVDGKPAGLDMRDRAGPSGANARASKHSAPIRLAPGRHFIEFQFTGLSFTAPDKVRFRWRLEGLEAAWTHGGAEVRRAAYNPVPLGIYKFRVQACNNDGVWNETGAELGLAIPEVFWKTTWFLALCGMMSAVALAGWVRHMTRERMQRRLERLEQQRSIERERTRIAQDLHDDLGASLTEISMLAASSGRRADTPEANGDPLAQIAQRSDHLLHAMDEIVWAVNPRHDSVPSLAEYLSAYASDFLGTAGIRARLDVPRDLAQLPMNPEQRHELFHAVKEAIRNAARHSQAAEVWLRVRVEHRTLTVRVEDDGRGFDPASVSAGNGLRNMRERLTRLGGTCRILKGNERGTTVELGLPLA